MRLREKLVVVSWPRRKTEKIPKKPSSLTARLSSRAAFVALCIESAANPPNRSVLLEIVDASLLLKVTAMAAAVSGSLSPWIHGEAQEITIYLEWDKVDIKRGRKVGTSVIEAHEVDVIGIHES